jgi:hypothetical protein
MADVAFPQKPTYGLAGRTAYLGLHHSREGFDARVHVAADHRDGAGNQGEGLMRRFRNPRYAPEFLERKLNPSAYFTSVVADVSTPPASAPAPAPPPVVASTSAGVSPDTTLLVPALVSSPSDATTNALLASSGPVAGPADDPGLPDSPADPTDPGTPSRPGDPPIDPGLPFPPVPPGPGMTSGSWAAGGGAGSSGSQGGGTTAGSNATSGYGNSAPDQNSGVYVATGVVALSPIN